MKRVYKYPIDITDNQYVAMPKNAQILTAQVQNGKPCLWALVDPNAKIEERTIRIAGTGHSISDEEACRLVYVATLQMHNGSLVFHVFEVKEKEMM